MRSLSTVTIVLAWAVFGGASGLAASSGLTLSDRQDDVKAADLDLTSMSATRTGNNLVVRFTLRGPVTKDVIYGFNLRVGSDEIDISAKRAAGTTSFFVFRWSDSQNVYVTGKISGRTATVIAPLVALGTSARKFRVWAVAEPTKGRRGGGDRAPNGAKTVSFSLR